MNLTDSSVPSLLEAGVAAHRMGNVGEAERLYRGILVVDSGHPDALHLLGMLALGNRQPGQAIELISRALQRGRPTGDMHNTLGIALRELGRLEEALAHFARATVRNPQLAAAWLNRGSTLLDLGRVGEALRCYQQCFALDPGMESVREALALALQRLGSDSAVTRALDSVRDPAASPQVILQQLATLTGRASEEGTVGSRHRQAEVLLEAGRVADTIAALERSLAENPNDLEAQAMLLEAYMADPSDPVAGAGVERALAMAEQWCAARPDSASLHYGRGGLLRVRGRREEAEEAFLRALEIDKDLAVARIDLAILLREDKDPVGAVEQLEALPPRRRDTPRTRRSYAAAELTRAAALLELRRPDEAIAALRALLAFDRRNAGAYNNLAYILNWRGDLDEAIAAIRKAIACSQEPAEPHSNLIFYLEFKGHQGEAAEQSERKRWYREHGRKHRTAIAPHLNDRDSDRPLRVGYVSGDFREHAAARVIAPVLFHHDPQQVEIACYATGDFTDWMTDRFRAASSLWRDITRMRDDAAAALIRRDRIDILVDLSGHTARNRLPIFARKPAPLQFTAWGLPRGTGLETIDYIFSDPVLIPPAAAGALSEKVIYLPCWMPYAPLQDDAALSPAPAVAGGRVTFAAIGRRAKLSRACLAAWAEILNRLPASRLLLLDDFCVAGDVAFVSRLQEAGLPLDRVEIRPRLSDRRQYLAVYSEIDLLLDSFPQGGGVTSFEALWMGVPIVTLLGRSSSARGSGAILTALGLEDFVAESVEAYIARALAAADDLPRLGALRGELRARMLASPICDAASYTQAVESAYRAAWREWCARER